MNKLPILLNTLSFLPEFLLFPIIRISSHKFSKYLSMFLDKVENSEYKQNFNLSATRVKISRKKIIIPLSHSLSCYRTCEKNISFFIWSWTLNGFLEMSRCYYFYQFECRLEIFWIFEFWKKYLKLKWRLINCDYLINLWDVIWTWNFNNFTFFKIYHGRT